MNKGQLPHSRGHVAGSPRTKCPPIRGFLSPSMAQQRAANFSLAPSSQRHADRHEFLTHRDWKNAEQRNQKKMRPRMPAYQIFGTTAHKPGLEQYAGHFDSHHLAGQYSLEETLPTQSIFMPSASFEKGSIGQQHSLYETAGEASLHE